jgi:membrane protease YdiL (CAAX protease family)
VNTPEFDLPETTEEPPSTPEPRNPLAWPLLGLVIVLLIAYSLSSYLFRPAREDTAAGTLDQQLRMAVAMNAVTTWLQQRSGEAATRRANQLQRVAELAYEERQDDPVAAMYYVAARHEMGEEVGSDHLAPIKASDKPGRAAFVQIYTADTLTEPQARELGEQLTGQSFLIQLARVHALERAGVEAPERRRWTRSGMAFMALGVGIVCFGGLGVILWILYFSARSGGRLAPVGHPAGRLTDGDSERFAVRTTQIIFAFMALSLVIGTVAAAAAGDRFATRSALLVQGILIVIAVVALTRVPIMGRRITLRDIGLTGDNFGRNVLWAIGGYLANIPIFLVAALVGQFLFRGLPTPEHPVATQLQQQPDLFLVVVLLFMAAVSAPIWEEICFRGHLLPGLSSRLRSPALGIAVSSLVFAAIHPTGIPAWLALAAVGFMAALLVYQTGSLVPAIVLHAIHNGALVGLNLALF